MTFRGFTIIEVLVTSAIAMMITGFLIANFNRSRNELAATAPSIIGDIRRAQSMTIAGNQYDGEYRCGFGVVFEPDGYTIYAGPPANGDCDNIVYDSRKRATGEPIEQVVLHDSLQFRTIGDVYFSPPLPYTYLDGALNAEDPLIIELGVRGKACVPNTCRSVQVDRAGQISSMTHEE